METQPIEDALGLLNSVQPQRPNRSVHMAKYGGGFDECKLSATPAGFVELAKLMLEAAITEKKPKASPSTEAIDIRLSPLLTRHSNIDFNWVERVVQIEEIRDHIEPSWQEKATAMAVVSAGLVALTLCGIGIYALWIWL